ncbi:MAG: GntR family transcriptional regulator [Acidobacteria bacterium]|nr:GntR family transcriptional regulator [Acidobacteriota bacterium]
MQRQNLTAAISDREPPQSLRTQIADAVEAAILGGEHPPGARLIERELVDRFGVSSIPVREALQDLEAKGLVVKVPNVGCRVVEFTKHDTEAVCEFRRTLEPLVFRWAAARITIEWHAPLTEQWVRFSRAAATGNSPDFFREDIAFHRLIWQIAGNRFASRALEGTIGPLLAAGLAIDSNSVSFNLQREARKHKPILDAILAGDGDRAANLLLEIAGNFEFHFRSAAIPAPVRKRGR